MRYTEKVGEGNYVSQPRNTQEAKNHPLGLINKLGRIEDIEGELGIDLITLYRALKSEYIYIKRDGEIHECGIELPTNIDENGWYFNLEACHLGEVYFKDYGKTWALTKEEME